MVNSVAIYDSSGNFIRRYGDAIAQKLYGVMVSDITELEKTVLPTLTQRLESWRWRTADSSGP